jgi:hypothetical protein
VICSVSKSRFESSVTAISWIPSEAISGPSKIPFEFGVTHYDEPPPDRLEDLDELRRSDRFREANELRAFIEVEDGRIVEHGHLGMGHIGATTVRLGPAAVRFPAVQLPDIRPIGEGDTLVRQGEHGTDVFLILDGMFVVEVDDRQVAEIGPGAVVGERAAMLNGARTATLWARTPGRVASVPHSALDQEALGTLASAHSRED